jgi:hypothetical protein
LVRSCKSTEIWVKFKEIADISCPKSKKSLIFVTCGTDLLARRVNNIAPPFPPQR